MCETTAGDARGDVSRPGGRWARLLLAVPTMAGALLVGACGDDNDDAGNGRIEDEAADVVESAGARVTAETLRAAIVAEDLQPGEHARDVVVIEEAVGDLPGEPDVSGIEDGDGDGQDDDGRVQVDVDNEAACLTIAENGEVDVSGGGC
jgi:hypothetical protein